MLFWKIPIALVPFTPIHYRNEVNYIETKTRPIYKTLLSVLVLPKIQTDLRRYPHKRYEPSRMV